VVGGGCMMVVEFASGPSANNTVPAPAFGRLMCRPVTVYALLPRSGGGLCMVGVNHPCVGGCLIVDRPVCLRRRSGVHGHAGVDGLGRPVGLARGVG
jgi:hypothetical protein